MYEKAKNFTLERPRMKKAIGVSFVVVGFVALVAPVIPGAPLIFIGFELLGIRLLFLDRVFKRKATAEE